MFITIIKKIKKSCPCFSISFTKIYIRFQTKMFSDICVIMWIIKKDIITFQRMQTFMKKNSLIFFVSPNTNIVLTNKT